METDRQAKRPWEDPRAVTAYEQYCRQNQVPPTTEERETFVRSWMGADEENRQDMIEAHRREAKEQVQSDLKPPHPHQSDAFVLGVSSQAKRPPEAANIGLDMVQSSLERMTVALAKCTQLMERHIASGEQTVPARALYFILRDAGYGTNPEHKQEVKQAQKQEQQANELHHSYGMRR